MSLDKEVTEYASKTGRSRVLHEEALAVMPGGNSRTTTFFDPYPFYFQRGQGAHIWDAADGRLIAELRGHEASLNMGEWSPTQHGIHISAFSQDAFLSLLANGVPTKFPRLRFGFIEAGAGWVRYMLWIAMYGGGPNDVRPEYEDVLTSSRFFITCELSEDIPALIRELGDNCLCVGTDYVHNDPHFDLSAFAALAARTDISQESATKLAAINAQRLYGLC